MQISVGMLADRVAELEERNRILTKALSEVTRVLHKTFGQHYMRFDEKLQREIDTVLEQSFDLMVTKARGEEWKRKSQ